MVVATQQVNRDRFAAAKAKGVARADAGSAAVDLALPLFDVFDLFDRSTRLCAYRVGTPQKSGVMTVLPIFGPDADRGDSDRGGKFAGAPSTLFVPPLSGLKLGGVKRGYGNVELHNPSGGGDHGSVAIVPLHVGYIQDGAQNHALCRSAFLGAGQRVVFEDACCVQQTQGGFLESREQWFFILPLALRESALNLRGIKSYGKLWPDIARLNARFGLAQRGHLEQIVCRLRAVLTQYQSRFELLAGQIGAAFFLGDRLAGLEIAPTAAYFQEVWMPLVCFCYGTAALALESAPATGATPGPPPALVDEAAPFAAHSLHELREQLAQSRRARALRLRDALARLPSQRFEKREEERFLDLRLFTAVGKHFAGQVVEDAGRLIYASLSARAGAVPGVL